MATFGQVREIETALRDWVPAGVGFAVGHVGAAVKTDFEGEASLLETGAEARRNEFYAGRNCARAALAQIGGTPRGIGRDGDGVPVWPCGYTGSISHSKGIVCAVASCDALQFLGLDLEKTNRLTPAAMLKVLHPAERASWGTEQRTGSMIFSVKEAFYKAQYPVFRVQTGFHDLVFSPAPFADEALSVEVVAEDWTPEMRQVASRMHFRYRFVGEYVLTLCWAARR